MNIQTIVTAEEQRINQEFDLSHIDTNLCIYYFISHHQYNGIGKLALCKLRCDGYGNIKNKKKEFYCHSYRKVSQIK